MHIEFLSHYKFTTYFQNSSPINNAFKYPKLCSPFQNTKSAAKVPPKSNKLSDGFGTVFIAYTSPTPIETGCIPIIVGFYTVSASSIS